MITPYIVVNEEASTFNVFDEDGISFKDDNEKIVGKFDEDNIEEAILMVYRLRPHLEKAWPHDM